jgi:cytochrome P450
LSNATRFKVSENDPIIARNPFWMKDEAWKEKRNEVMPAMTTVKLKAMYPLIVDATKNLVNFIAREIEKEKTRTFDSRDICARYTCDSICSCTFGTDAQSFTASDPFFYHKGRQLLRGMADSLQSYLPKKMLPDEVEKFFIEIAKEAIKCRTENQIRQEDFLTHTISIREKKGMSDIDAAAHCVTLFLDGYETTSVTLHHALYEIGKNKEIQAKLRKEIAENIDGEVLSYEKVFELPYLNQVFYETLRLHPPLLLTTRVASEDYEVKGFKGHKFIIKKNSSIWIPIPSIQRDPGRKFHRFLARYSQGSFFRILPKP